MVSGENNRQQQPAAIPRYFVWQLRFFLVIVFKGNPSARFNVKALVCPSLGHCLSLFFFFIYFNVLLKETINFRKIQFHIYQFQEVEGSRLT